MNVSAPFIHRPIATSLLGVAVLFGGMLGYWWLPVSALVFAAVGVTTAAVAMLAHTLRPDMPWSAAIALGAIVAPPDAVAATAVLRPLRPPQRILGILEGESLLNDASALL